MWRIGICGPMGDLVDLFDPAPSEADFERKSIPSPFELTEQGRSWCIPPSQCRTPIFWRSLSDGWCHQGQLDFPQGTAETCTGCKSIDINAMELPKCLMTNTASKMTSPFTCDKNCWRLNLWHLSPHFEMSWCSDMTKYYEIYERTSTPTYLINRSSSPDQPEHFSSFFYRRIHHSLKQRCRKIRLQRSPCLAATHHHLRSRCTWWKIGRK